MSHEYLSPLNVFAAKKCVVCAERKIKCCVVCDTCYTCHPQVERPHVQAVIEDFSPR